jgi:hypothetical protein
MNSLAPIPTLPQLYMPVFKIRSMEVRVKLAKQIDSILKLIRLHKNFEIQPHVKVILDRYFKFLNATMTSHEEVEPRSTWLSIYSRAIEIQLLKSVARWSKTDVDSIEPDQHIMSAVVELVEVIFRYCVVKNTAAAVNYNLIELVDNLIVESNQTPQSLHISDRQGLIDLITDVSSSIDAMTKSNVVYEDDEDRKISSWALAICKMLRHYNILHQHPT